MGSEALEVVRELCEAIEANDWGRGTETFNPDVVQYGTRGGIDQDRVIRGREAVVDYWREVEQTWAGLEIEIEQLLDAGDNIVAFPARDRTQPSQRPPSSQRDGNGLHGSERNDRRGEGYMDREEALQAAGFSE